MDINSKLKILNTKQVPNYKSQTAKSYDLGRRTFKFAKQAIQYVNSLPKTMSNIEIGKQLIRSSSSVGANYIEAEEALSKKDFRMRIKISKKESKETAYWLDLSDPNDDRIKERDALTKEAGELMRIFGAIVEKSK